MNYTSRNLHPLKKNKFPHHSLGSCGLHYNNKIKTTYKYVINSCYKLLQIITQVLMVVNKRVNSALPPCYIGHFWFYIL